MTRTFAPRHVPQLTEWSQKIPEHQWEIYQKIMDEAGARHIPFALGGAFAMATYTGFWRNTKDLDLYVLPQHREHMIQVLTDHQLSDYYEKLPYDRWWIYRGYKNENIVDVIWAMANHRQEIDELWMSGPEIEIRGRPLKVLPPEAMLWDKLYIMQRERCDWQDVLNLLYATGATIDWQYLVFRIGEDTPLLTGALSVFRWIAPGRARTLPDWIWDRLRLQPPPEGPQPEIEKRRVDLLDKRPWFGPDREKLHLA